MWLIISEDKTKDQAIASYCKPKSHTNAHRESLLKVITFKYRSQDGGHFYYSKNVDLKTK